jgi:Prokaryotic E2 family A
MVATYHELKNVSEIASAAQLSIPRSKEVVKALARQPGYTLVQLLQHAVDGVPKLECVIVDVECDGVPPKNVWGITYRERFALCVPDNPKQLVEVLALRKNFPTLMHQNQGDPDAPASLCLYFESPSAVMRTWTAQSFLRRIQWWLEMSAKGELHPADQPVEHLFFAAQYELILPCNFTDLQKIQGQRFVITRGPERLNKGFTCLLEPSAYPAYVVASTTRTCRARSHNSRTAR